MRPVWFLVGLAIPVGLLALLLGFRGPNLAGAHVERFLVHRDLHEVLVRPKGAGEGLGSALHALGSEAPDVLLADGGDHSYWHDRRDGACGSSLVREAIPAAIARLHADGSHVAIGGISMGGFGALDAQDFARNDLVHLPFPFRGAVWLDVGASDPFLAGDTAFARAHGLRLRVSSGGHSGSYWKPRMAAYLRFYAQALRSCRR